MTIAKGDVNVHRFYKLSDGTLGQLKKRSKDSGLSASEIIRRAVLTYLESRKTDNATEFSRIAVVMPVALVTQLTEYNAKTGNSRQDIVQKAVDAYLVSTERGSYERSN